MTVKNSPPTFPDPMTLIDIKGRYDQFGTCLITGAKNVATIKYMGILPLIYDMINRLGGIRDKDLHLVVTIQDAAEPWPDE